MSSLIASLAVAASFAAVGLSDASGGYGRACVCPCPCPCVPAVQAPQDVAPAVAPPEGETEQSQSIEPQAAPPAAPQSGTTFRNYSVQPTPTYQLAPRQSVRSQPLDPVQRRQHPSNRLMGP